TIIADRGVVFEPAGSFDQRRGEHREPYLTEIVLAQGVGYALRDEERFIFGNLHELARRTRLGRAGARVRTARPCSATARRGIAACGDVVTARIAAGRAGATRGRVTPGSITARRGAAALRTRSRGRCRSRRG